APLRAFSPLALSEIGPTEIALPLPASSFFTRSSGPRPALAATMAVVADKPHLLVAICKSSECSARGSDRLYEEIRTAVEAARVGDRVTVRRGGCWGLCNLGPNVVV